MEQFSSPGRKWSNPVKWYFNTLSTVTNSHGDPFVINLCLTIDLFDCFHSLSNDS